MSVQPIYGRASTMAAHAFRCPNLNQDRVKDIAAAVAHAKEVETQAKARRHAVQANTVPCIAQGRENLPLARTQSLSSCRNGSQSHSVRVRPSLVVEIVSLMGFAASGGCTFRSSCLRGGTDRSLAGRDPYLG